MKIYLSVSVWGEAYVQQLIECCLSSLLAPKNRAALDEWETVLNINVPPQDRGLIESSNIYRKLISSTRVTFSDFFPARRGENKYEILSASQCDDISRAYDSDFLVPLYPDCIFADGALDYALRVTRDGSYDAFFAPVPFVSKGAIESERRRSGNGAELTVAPAQLAQILYEDAHPEVTCRDWDNPHGTVWPSGLVWTVPHRGWVMRYFHMHPAVMKIDHKNFDFFTRFSISLDYEYVSYAFKSRERVFIPSKTDKFCACTIRPAAQPNSFSIPWSSHALAAWAEEHATPIHREFFNAEFLWCWSEPSGEEWERQRRRAKEIARTVTTYLNLSDTAAAATAPAIARARKRNLRKWRKIRKWRAIRRRYIIPPEIRQADLMTLSRRALRLYCLLALESFLIRQFCVHLIGALRRIPILRGYYARYKRYKRTLKERDSSAIFDPPLAFRNELRIIRQAILYRLLMKSWLG